MVSDSSSDRKGGGGEQRPAPFCAYTQRFNEVFPYYLAIGMTYDQFWEQDCELVRAYRKAAQIKRDIANHDAWLQGMYIYEALCDVSPVLHAFAKKGAKPIPYSAEPYSRTAEQKANKEKENNKKARVFMETLMSNINQKFKKGGDTNER